MRQTIAHPAHTIVVLLIIFSSALYGYLAQRKASAHRATPERTSQAKSFALNIAFEWAFLVYIWAGVRRKGGRMSDLVGGRWSTPREIATDIAIAIPFWILWTATARLVWRVIGPPSSRGANYNFPPRGTLDIILWIALSVTAGFCEEVIYRGYLQKQLAALTSSSALAIFIQAALFGIGHVYQNAKAAVVVAVLALLYGALATWRRSLRPGMLSHAWSDVFEGYIKHITATAAR